MLNVLNSEPVKKNITFQPSVFPGVAPMRSEEKKRRVTVYTSVIIYIGQYDQNDRNAILNVVHHQAHKNI